MIYEDAFRIIRNRIRTTPGTTLDPASVDKPGSVTNIFAAAAAELLVEADARSAGRFASAFASSARGADLDRVILELSYGQVIRKSAAAGSYVLNVSRSGSAAGTLPQGTVLLAGGLPYALTAPLSFAAGSTATLSGTFTCQQLGSATNQAFSAVTGFQAPSGLFDPTMAVAVPPAAVNAPIDPSPGTASGGADAESDPDYLSRFASWDAGLDRNLLYLSAEARELPGVQYATAIEDLDSMGNPIGTATLYIADVNGRANSALVAAVNADSRNWRLVGQRINIVGATPTLVTLVLHVAILAGYDQTAVQNAVLAAVVSYVNKLLPGAFLTLNGIKGAMATVPGVVFESSAPSGVVSPVTDIAPPLPSTLFRTQSALVTFQ